MKKPGLIWMTAALAAGTAFAQPKDDYRTFTDLKGRTVSARIVDYNQTSARLLIERDDQRRIWVDAAVFCRSDQTYIQDWLDSYRVLSEEALTITIEPQESPLLKVKSLDVTKRTKSRYRCSITVEMKNDVTVEQCRIEYRCFVTDDESHADPDSLCQYGGEFLIGNVTEGQTFTFKTGTIDLISDYVMQAQSNLFGTNQSEILIRKDRLLGVWFKVHGSSPGGVPVVRDICIPQDLYEEVTWGNPTTQLATPTNADLKANTLASGGN